jgi:uncharacterized phage protein gp47/JayE
MPLPIPPFTGYSPELIRDRIRAALGASGYDIHQGSFAWDLSTPVAFEIGGMYQVRMNFLVTQMFPDTATGDFLDAHAALFRLERRQPTASRGVIRFEGKYNANPNLNAFVPTGVQVSTVVDPLGTQPSVIAQTTTSAAMDPAGYVDIEATVTQPGTIGNVAAGRFTLLLSPLQNITGINNPLAFSGGADRESDASLRAAIARASEFAGSSGNQTDLFRWTREATQNYGQIKVIPLWNGRGTAKIVMTDASGGIPNGATLAQVKNYIDPPPNGWGLGKAPIDQAVTVEGPTVVNIALSMIVIPESTIPNASFLAAPIAQALTGYVQSLNMGDDVLRAELIRVIMEVPGVYNITTLTVNGGNLDVPVSDTQKAVLAPPPVIA